MRKNRKFLPFVGGMILSAALAVGAWAAFGQTNHASQTLNVGGAQIVVTTTTPGATVDQGNVSCPAISVDVWNNPTADALVGCNFTLSSPGGFGSALGVHSMTITETASVNGGAKYYTTVHLTGSGGTLTYRANTQYPLTLASTEIWNTPDLVDATFPISFTGTLGWAGLGASDIGSSITVNYQVSAT